MNDDLKKKAGSVLDKSVEDLDAKTTRQLFEARQKALNELDKVAWWKSPALKPVGAIAAGLAVFMLVSPVYKVAENSNGLALPADMELMASADNLEMVEELDMIQWLLESEDYAS